MTAGFSYFVILAVMRTGSNFLEANLNAIDGVTCHGEAFNPHFLGRPGRPQLLGVTRAERDADPKGLLDRFRSRPGLVGFRLFHDHNPRILSQALADPECGKIILCRDPLESFVSLQIARLTGQWKLTDARHRKTARVHFDPDAFADYQTEVSAFYAGIRTGLLASGQTAAVVAYPDLQSLEVLNGLADWLGASGRLSALSDRVLRQNPAALARYVENPQDLPQGTGRILC